MTDKIVRRTYEGYPEVGHDGEVTLYRSKNFASYQDGQLKYEEPICLLGENIEDLTGKKIRITIEVIEEN